MERSSPKKRDQPWIVYTLLALPMVIIVIIIIKIYFTVNENTEYKNPTSLVNTAFYLQN
jgi:hypothetical protein